MSTREEILKAAKRLFARKGFEGASVRTICEAAGASANGVTYHFGSKQALFAEIVENWTSEQLELAQRVLQAKPESREDFRIRLKLFLGEALDALQRERHVVRIVFRGEEILWKVGGSAGRRLFEFNQMIVRFLRAGVEIGIVAADVDVTVVAGILHDRLVNQAAFGGTHKKHLRVSTIDESYRAEWVEANLRIVLGGILAREGDTPADRTLHGAEERP